MLQDLYRKVRGVLNKLTPQKFRTLVSQVQALPIDSSDRLKGVINLVFEKVRQPSVAAATLKYKGCVNKSSLCLKLCI
jgi:translation initiation factor 4G